MKQKLFYLIATSFVLVVAKFIMTGFKKITGAVLESFQIPDTNDRLILKLNSGDLKEQIRKINIRREPEGKIYIECVSVFKSDKLTVGRRDNFVVPIDETATMVAINRNEGCYEVILEKDENGNWHKPYEISDEENV